MKITIEARVQSDPQTVWSMWNTPADICRWNAASPDWHTTRSEVDLRVGGKIWARMEAKDGSVGFDFGGTYTVVDPPRRLVYVLGDGREVDVEFVPEGDGVRIVETFDAEGTHDPEFQRAGWQAILDNFVRYVEAEGR